MAQFNPRGLASPTLPGLALPQQPHLSPILLLLWLLHKPPVPGDSPTRANAVPSVGDSPHPVMSECQTDNKKY